MDIITLDSVETKSITEIRDIREREVKVCHFGTGRLSIPFDYNPRKFAILYRPIYDAESANLFQKPI